MTRVEALDIIRGCSEDCFIRMVSHSKLPLERKKIIFDVVQNRKGRVFDVIDIEEFALKLCFPDVYKDFKIYQHLGSKSDLYEYDPAKNGQNIIKHGMSFSEVTSYSSRFGTLLIECPDIVDGRRVLIFSDVLLDKNKLAYPIDANLNSGTRYVLSIASHAEAGGFRFISSRFISSDKEKYKANIKQSIRSIEFPDNLSKNLFVDRCVEIVEKHLIK